MAPDQFIYGARTWQETYHSVVEASLFQNSLTWAKPWIFPLVGVTGLICLLISLLRFRTADGPSRRLIAWSLLLWSISGATIALHWTLSVVRGLLLPMDRTAIYFFPLILCSLGAAVAIPPRYILDRLSRGAALAALAGMGIYFVFCLRLNYFEEWSWDSDVAVTYSVLSCLNQSEGVTRVASGWLYMSALEFYRTIDKSPRLTITEETPDSQDIQVFVIHPLPTPAILERRKLSVFYHGPTSDLVLAAPGDLAERLRGNQCLNTPARWWQKL